MNTIQRKQEVRLFKLVEEKLIKEFDTECPPEPEHTRYESDINKVLDHFVKWYLFWDNRQPILDLHNINQNIILEMTAYICQEQKIEYLKTLTRLNLLDKFNERIDKARELNDHRIV